MFIYFSRERRRPFATYGYGAPQAPGLPRAGRKLWIKPPHISVRALVGSRPRWSTKIEHRETASVRIWFGARLGRTDCNVFRYSPPSRALGSLTATQPGRVTKPTQGHPGSPWGACQAECWPLRREPQPPAQHGSCAAERCRSRARPGQRLPPCMCSGGTSRHLLVTSPKRARAI